MRMRLIVTVQHHASGVYIINAVHSLLYRTMHDLFMAAKSALSQPNLQHYSMYMHAGMELNLHDRKYKLGAAGGEQSKPPCLYIILIII